MPVNPGLFVDPAGFEFVEAYVRIFEPISLRRLALATYQKLGSYGADLLFAMRSCCTVEGTAGTGIHASELPSSRSLNVHPVDSRC